MASGRQIAEENVQAFLRWMAGKSDDDYRAMALRGVLSRKEIAKECGFAKSALDQNPRIKTALRELEDGLRQRNVLPLAVAKGTEKPQDLRLRDKGTQQALLDRERLRRLEQENACLRAENAELKRRLNQHAILREALALTGRLPR
jgi:hypothetical protein